MSNTIHGRVLQHQDETGNWLPAGIAVDDHGTILLWRPGGGRVTELPARGLRVLSQRDLPDESGAWRWCEEVTSWHDIGLRPWMMFGTLLARSSGVPVSPRAPGAGLTVRKDAPLRVRPPHARRGSLAGPLPVPGGISEPHSGAFPQDASAALPVGFRNRPVPVLVPICAPVLGPAAEDPPSHPPPNGWREWLRIREAVTQVFETGHPCPLRFVRLRPPTLDRLNEALHLGTAEGPFQAVHVIGCAQPGFLAMEKENGREHPIAPREFARAFSGMRVAIVILNICYGSAFIVPLLEAGVSAVITSTGEISEPEANLLARALYLRLALGDTIGEAHAGAQSALVAAYADGRLQPLADYEGQAPEAYAQERAANIILRGDPAARLTLPHASDAALPPAFDVCEPPNNLPHPDDLFIGRGKELVQIGDWMEEHRFHVIAITGFGGTGKSALALRAAQRNRWRYRRIIHLTGRDADGRRHGLMIEDLCRHFEAALGLGSTVTSRKPEAQLQWLAEMLKVEPTLLVLDNLESLSPGEALELSRVLQVIDHDSGSMAVLTLRGEHFPPLVDQRRKNFYHLPLSTLAQPDAVALLAELLRPPMDRPCQEEDLLLWEKVPERPLPRLDRDRYIQLAERADVPLEKVCALDELASASSQHPLLLRFAAAELREPAMRWAEVVVRFQGLHGSDLQQQAENLVGLMSDQLRTRAPQAFELLQALLVFAHGATHEALRAVWCGNEEPAGVLETQAFIDACQAARRAALLDFRDGRFVLHPLVRQFLLTSRPGPTELRQRWHRNHAAFFLAFAEQHAHEHGKIDRERRNIFNAVEGAEQAGEPPMVARLAEAIFDYCLVRGFWSEGRAAMLHGVAAAQQTGDVACEARLRYKAGVLCRYQGDYRVARQLLDGCLALEAHEPQQALRAQAILELGILDRYMDVHERARHSYEQCLKLGRQLNDRLLQARALHEFSVLSTLLGDYSQARTHALECLRLADELGDNALIVNALHQLSVQCCAQKDYDGARGYCEDALTLMRDVEDKVLKARILNELGVAHGNSGDFALAFQFLEQSLDLKQQLGHKAGQAATLHFLGGLKRRQGNLDEAEAFHRQSLQLARELNSLYWRAWNLYGLGLCARGRRDMAQTRKLLDEALHLAEQIGVPLAEKVHDALMRM